MAAITTAPPRPPTGALFARILAIAGALALGVAAGLIIVMLVATRLFDYQVLTVSSGSMSPVLETGDLIVVKPASTDDVSEGDVVLFKSGGDRIPTVHRVVGVNEIETRIRDSTTGGIEVSTERRLVTQGDANAEPDGREVTGEQLRGQVWFSIPNAGAIAGTGLAPAMGIVFGGAIAAWAAWEIALRLKSRRNGVAESG